MSDGLCAAMTQMGTRAQARRLTSQLIRARGYTASPPWVGWGWQLGQAVCTTLAARGLGRAENPGLVSCPGLRVRDSPDLTGPAQPGWSP